MRAKTFAYLFVLLLASACAPKAPVSDNPGNPNDPISGRWTGQYETAPGRNETISVDLRWQEPNLSGTVLAGARSFPLTKASFAPDTGVIAMEFEAEGNGGRAVHYKIDGKINGDAMTGNWTHDGQRGEFRVRKE